MFEFYQNTILANTCFGTGQWHTVKTPFPQFTAADPNWEKKFHVWRMDWDESSIKLYLDNQLLNETDVTKTINPDGSNAFHKPEYLLLNLAIGSTGGDPSQTKFPAKFEIRSVRVYQRNP
jgi:beta-glucanase (GH16 family)